ncbi:MAG: tetratricopeptide repeat protein [Dokdonella sp.]|nr:MAG: tetratricopeptide repeat protein [Dokdonella sp.]
MTARLGLLEELRRRHVWRVAIAYAVTSWLVVQVATQVFPFFEIPNWAVRLVILVIVLGFPVVVVLAWVYEITPEGIRRTRPASAPDARPAHVGHRVARTLNVLIIALLTLAVAVLGWRVWVLQHPVGHATIAGTNARLASLPPALDVPGQSFAVGDSISQRVASASDPRKSVAVLPFDNAGDDRNQQYFSDGLSQDLITALSQFDSLKVISRDSAFRFRGSQDSPRIIAAKLGVAHLLEGSVRKQNDALRVSVTLVNAADGSVVWSQRYDKPYGDLFALQDAITQSVADALQARLVNTASAAAQSERPPSGNLAAWQAYQQGQFYTARNTQADVRQAIDAYAEAARLDPRYAAAHARMSYGWAGLASQYLIGSARDEAWARAREASNTALQLAPGLAQARRARGHLLLNADFDWLGAEAEYRRAVELAPHDAGMLFSLGNLDAVLGRVESAVVLTREAIARDPLRARWYNWLGIYLAALGQLDEAQRMIEAAIELQPNADSFHEQLAVIAILRGDAVAALAAAEQENDPSWRRVALALATQIGTDRNLADTALATLIAHDAENAPYQISEAYAVRGDADNTFLWLDRAWEARDPGVSNLLVDPLLLRFRTDARFALFCAKAGLPTATAAVAMRP